MQLIEDIPYALSPALSPRHQWVSSNIKYELKNAIKKAGCKHCKEYDFIDIKVSEDIIDAAGTYQLQQFSQKEPFTFFFEDNCSADIILDNIW